MKCSRQDRHESRLDHYFLRERSNNARGDERQEIVHSPQNPEPHEAGPDVDTSTDILAEVTNDGVSDNAGVPQHPRPAPEKSINGLRKKVKWPKSCSKNEWATIDTDLTARLECLKGPAVRKLDRIGDIIYEYGEEMFGVVESGPKVTNERGLSRRQCEIKRLVKEKRQLSKQWKVASEEEREGIDVLQAEIKERLASLRRAESHKNLRKKREKARSSFFKEPFRYVKGLFTQEKSGSLKAGKQEIEEHLRRTYTDEKRHEFREIPNDMPPLPQPVHSCETFPPRLSEVEKAVKKARAGSAPGPNGVPYLVYKRAPGVTRFLWKLMKVVWEKKQVPRAWRRAGGIMIPKEKESEGLDQFRQISLLNVEGKIFFSVVARRLTTYLRRNDLVDCSVQKAGIPGFSGCLEHVSVIWQQIQSAKREKRDLHVLFLDLANAFGSVPHSLIWTAFEYFKVPDQITQLVKSYFQDLQFCVTTDVTTAWQPLEIGIMAGCTISPLAFTVAMEVIIRASRWVVGGERLSGGYRLPPIRAYMDDLTTLTTTIPCTKRLLGKLQENIDWARMKFKPSKSRSISIVEGKLVEHRFRIGETDIPLVSELPVKSLGRWYNDKLSDAGQCAQIREQAVKGLLAIDKTPLPGRLKLWCFQFGLLPRLMWPLTVYEVPISGVERLEGTVSSYIRKWLGLPRCLTSLALYNKGALSLPVSSLTEEFKAAKVRLEMTLGESQDRAVREANPKLRAGRKWVPAEAVKQAKAALRHADIVGHVQHGRRGLGYGESRPVWQKALPVERRKLVVGEVRRQEEATRSAVAVSQAQQGQWTNWRNIEHRTISWKDIWHMEGKRLSFLIRAAYDVLPTPKNLQQWVGEDPSCSLCHAPANLKHILSGCKVSLTQGRYTWRHNQVLRELASALEIRRVEANTQPGQSSRRPNFTAFVRAGEESRRTQNRRNTSALDRARDWEMRADLDRMMVIPAEIVETSLRPDIILWSKSQKTCFFIELTVPWEGNIEEAYERKKSKYAEIAAQAEHNGWRTEILPVEVGCRGFVAKSTSWLLKYMGLTGGSHRKAVRALESAAQNSSNWIWIRRKQEVWAKQ